MDMALYYLFRFNGPLLIAEIIFIMHFSKKQKCFWLKLIISSLVYIFLSSILPFFNLQLNLNGWFRFDFLIIFLLSLIPMAFSLKTSFKSILFIAMAAYSIQNCSDNFMSFLGYIFNSPTEMVYQFLIYFASLTITYTSFYFIFVNNINSRFLEQIDNRIFILVLLITLGVTYVLSMYSSFSGDAPNSISVKIYSVITCLLLLCIQFNIFEKRSLIYQNEVLEQLLHKENEIHKKSKKNMDLLNMKCHDLKHQIATLREYSKTDIENQALNELEEQVNVFDSFIKSGNDTLDAILTEKALVCENLKIKFSCMVEGSKLDFMKSIDIYSLFGNAIDNAIEAIKDQDIEKRIITINVKEVNSMLAIHIENYCDKQLTFKNGLPETTKKHAEWHGFGTKSIQYITKKYNGNVIFKIENNEFIVNIMFPLEKN